MFLAEPVSPSLLLHPPCGYFVNVRLQLKDGKVSRRKGKKMTNLQIENCLLILPKLVNTFKTLPIKSS